MAIRILNRVIEWTEEGILYEADHRHAEIIVRKMELDTGTKPAVTPGVKREEESDDDLEMSPHESTEYRAIVARANYLAQDRSDIQYAVKELCRNMSCPPRGDWKTLKRLSRYLLTSSESRSGSTRT